MATIFIIDDDGMKHPVSSVSELQDFARSGFVLPETKIEAKGRIVFARQIKELVGFFNVAENPGPNSDKTRRIELEPMTDSSFKSPLSEESHDQGEPPVPSPLPRTGRDSSSDKAKTSNRNESFQKDYHLLDIDERKLEKVARERISTSIKNPIRVIKTVVALGWIIGTISAFIFMAYGFLETEGIGVIGIMMIACVVLSIPLLLAKVITSPIQASINIQLNNAKDALRREIYLAQLLKKNESED